MIAVMGRPRARLRFSGLLAALVPGAAWADHGGALQSAPLSPMIVGLLVVIVMLLIRRRAPPG